MANGSIKVSAIAWTAFQETMRRRVFFFVAFIALIVAAGIASEAVTVQMAQDAGETRLVSELHTDTVLQILTTWQVAVGALALYLGAIGLSSEVAGKTLVHVLSRPVDSATYLAGRWFGTLGFLWSFQAIGVVFATIITFAFNVPHTPTLWLACASMFVAAFFFSGVSLGLSVVMPPVAAGVIAFFLTILPSMVEDTLKHPHWLARGLSYVAYYVSPAQMPANLTSLSFNKEALNPAYGLYVRVLGENALYTVVVFAIGCALFARREMKQR